MSDVVNPEPASTVHQLDVRPILAAGGSPFGAIMEAVLALPARGALRLIAPFEPVPLYARLGEMGLEHSTRQRDDGAWEILFVRRTVAAPEPVLLDLRSLEPPEPMRCALETLATLPAGGTLIALTRFRPVHLLSILDERGFAWETNEQTDGAWETIITNGP